MIPLVGDQAELRFVKKDRYGDRRSDHRRQWSVDDL